MIGAGQNGLVAANLLVDAGWEVTVLEAEGQPGGAVRTEELTGVPDFRHDVYSSFFPLAVASPAMQALDLDSYGLRWRRGELVVAHPARDGTCAVLSTDLDTTVASLDAFAPGDGEAWRRLFALWERVEGGLTQGFATPMPPIVPGVRVAAALRRDLGRFLRFLALPVRRLTDEEFRGEGATRLLAGHAAHADLAPDAPLSSVFAWTLACLGQRHGFPTPEGGAGSLIAALARRLEARGGTIRCDAPVEAIAVRRGRAVGVRVAGSELRARRAVLAAVNAPMLYRELVGPEHLPRRLLEDLDRFEWDAGTVKVDWALDRPIPWAAPDARRSGVVHVADHIDESTQQYAELAMGLLPARPCLVMGQYSMVDPTRSPAGTDTAWAYTHVPQRARGDAAGELTGRWDERAAEAFADRIEGRIEALAPGFRAGIRARHVLTPATFTDRDRNLTGGSMMGGTAQLHQEAIFRPTPGLGRPETPVRRLFLASGSVHPGGGVHGGPGANAARAALAWDRVRAPARLIAAAAGARR